MILPVKINSTYLIMSILFLMGTKLVATQQKYTRSRPTVSVHQPVAGPRLWIKRLNGLTSLLFAEESSNTFSGNYYKEGQIMLTISVRDGAYRATFVDKQEAGDSSCTFWGIAREKKGVLSVSSTRSKHPVTITIRKEDVGTMVVRATKHDDWPEALLFGKGQKTLIGRYTKGR